MRSADTIARRCAPADDGVDELGHRLEVEAGDEPGGPQHPQRVVVEADLGRQRGAQHALGPGRRAAVRVDEHRAGGAGDRRPRAPSR